MNDSPISSLSFDFDLGSMSFSSLFKKASNLLGIGSPSKPPPLDGEVCAFSLYKFEKKRLAQLSVLLCTVRSHSCTYIDCGWTSS